VKRYIIIGVAGVVVILIALILTYRLNPDEDAGPGETPPVALAPTPEPAPAPATPAVPAASPDLPSAPVVEPDAAAPGGPVAVPDSAAESPPGTGSARLENSAAAPAAAPPIPQPRGVATGLPPNVPPVPSPPQTEATPAPTAVPAAPAPAPAAPAPAPAAPAPAPAPAPPETAAAPPPTATSPAGEPKVALLPPPEIERPATMRPSFDVVRVTPDGETVIAGRAAPGAVVTVYDGGRPIGEVRADSRGEWVLVPADPLPPGSRELSVSARSADDAPVWSDSVVVVVVPETGRDVAGRAAEKPSEPLVVEVPRTGFGASNVLQQPRPDGSGVRGGGDSGFDLAVTVLDYDSAGNLSLTGRARAGSDIRIYLDNGLLGRAPSDADGNWRLTVRRAIAARPVYDARRRGGRRRRGCAPGIPVLARRSAGDRGGHAAGRRAAGQQPVAAGAPDAGRGRAVYGHLRGQPRPHPRSGPHLSGADLRGAADRLTLTAADPALRAAPAIPSYVGFNLPLGTAGAMLRRWRGPWRRPEPRAGRRHIWRPT